MDRLAEGWMEEPESEVQPKDRVENYLRYVVYLEFVKRTTRNRHLRGSVSAVGDVPIKVRLNIWHG
jgi:hypothetical protein